MTGMTGVMRYGGSSFIIFHESPFFFQHSKINDNAPGTTDDAKQVQNAKKQNNVDNGGIRTLAVLPTST